MPVLSSQEAKSRWERNPAVLPMTDDERELGMYYAMHEEGDKKVSFGQKGGNCELNECINIHFQKGGWVNEKVYQKVGRKNLNKLGFI